MTNPTPNLYAFLSAAGETTKPPRAYADEILQLPTREARAAALEAVPAQYRELVKRHVECAFAVRRTCRAETNDQEQP